MKSIYCNIVFKLSIFSYCSGPDEWHGHFPGFCAAAKWKYAQFCADWDLYGRFEDESHRQLPSADYDSGGDQITVLLHWGGRVMQTHQGQSYRLVSFSCFT